MSLVVLIERPVPLEDYIEADMRRWWSQRCVKHERNGEIYFDVGGPRFRLYGGVERLKSFSVKARVARRPT